MARSLGRAINAALAVILVACSGGGESAGFVNRSAEDYCALSQSSTLFLIDRTTVFDTADRERLMTSLGGVIDQLETGDRIVIATISDHYSRTRKLVSACKPGCPEPGSVVDEIVSSCSTMKARRDDRAFTVALADALREIIDTAEDADRSDIIRTIAYWTQSAETDPFSRLVIFSDMLENSELVSWRQFAATSDADLMDMILANDAIANLPDGRVQIIGYGRFHDAARSPLRPEIDRKLRGFWSDYFGAAGGEVSFSAGVSP